jgi:CO/xanthine dehydrogenase FAD-binding subunit
MVQLAAGRLSARPLLSISRLDELNSIEVSADSVKIGSGVTYTDIRNCATLCEEFPLLPRAASWTGSIANQNRGTLGGNIVNASPAADSPPALLVYDASVEVRSVRGSRYLQYDEFHTGYKQTLLEPDELLTSIILPRKPRPGLHTLRKVGARKAQAISKIALAGYGELVGDKLTEIRIAFASLSATPLRCVGVESCVRGRPLTEETLDAARHALSKEIHPIDDIRSTASYRRKVSANLLTEFLTEIKETQS